MATVRLPDRPGRNHISVAQIPREELANTVTHAAGIALGVAATAVLTVRAIAAGDPRRIFAFLVFGFTIVLLYTASTLYHGQTDPRRKARLQVFDHVSIYYLIAGSYTPVALVGLVWGAGEGLERHPPV